MSISAELVRFDDDVMWVHLSDDCILGVPLAWFPRLMDATCEALARVTISAYGLLWEDLDEDISVPALLAGEAGRMRRLKSGQTRCGSSGKWYSRRRTVCRSSKTKGEAQLTHAGSQNASKIPWGQAAVSL